jgi:hypothetical protein
MKVDTLERILIAVVFRALMLPNLLALVLLSAAAIPLIAQTPVTIPEEIEWTWEVRPPHPDGNLPNVLLLGDSISRNYFGEVEEKLAGVANVYLMASSISVGDPRLERQIAEFAETEKVTFRVVHFNNGMHGWAYGEDQYEAAFPAFLQAVRSITEKNGTVIWANTTPVRPDAKGGATNARIDHRNSVALVFVKAARIRIDDQHGLMLQHQDLYQDSIHFNPAGAIIQGDQVVALIRSALDTGNQHAAHLPS